MATAKQLHLLATRPQAFSRYARTGVLPRGVVPESPLIDLLRRLAPRDLGQIRGLTIDSRLGYAGSRQFQTGHQALRWIAPAEEVFDSFPAESWRLKRFAQPLTLEDLAACASAFSDQLYEAYPRLRRAPRGLTPD